MAKKKIGKKELKQPDQFLGFWQRTSAAAGAFASAHTRALVIGVSTLFTVVVGSVVISQISEHRAAAASAALDRAEKIADADADAAKTPGAPKDDSIPHFGTAKERLEAALKEIDAHFGSSHTPLYAEAMLVRGRLLLDLDRAGDAAAVFGGLVRDRLSDRLRFLAREGLGYAYERQGKLVEAQAAFAKLGDDSASLDSFYKDRARYHEARIAEQRGNPADAVRLYREVLDKNPTTSLRDEITNRLAVLELK